MVDTPVSTEWEIVSPGPLRSLEELSAAARPTPGPSRKELQRKRGAFSRDEARRLEAFGTKEIGLQWTLRGEALAAGWLYYHNDDSRKADIGFPDTVCVRAPRTLFIELKQEHEAVPKHQLAWLLELMVAGHEVYVLRPSGWRAMVERLS